MLLSNSELERYSRQIVMKEIGYAGQKRLKEGSVMVIGAGGLGSPALMYLAAAGVGRIGIADFDCVDISNLQRQIAHNTGRLGESKAESAKKTLLELNPEIEVTAYDVRVTPDNIGDLIREYDIVLDCSDRMTNKLMINDACVRDGKPFVHAGILRGAGQIMTWIPGHNFPCFRCFIGNEDPDEDSCETCATAGVLGAAVGMAGCLQAAEAIKYLTGSGELLTGRVLFFDVFGMEFSEISLPERLPDCRACGETRHFASGSRQSGQS